jgi:hypothetical protein
MLTIFLKNGDFAVSLLGGGGRVVSSVTFAIQFLI